MNHLDELQRVINDMNKELERLSYNQVIINRGMIHLKQALDFLQNGRLEDIRRFLETYDEDGGEQGTVRRDDETSESKTQEVPRDD